MVGFHDRQKVYRQDEKYADRAFCKRYQHEQIMKRSILTLAGSLLGAAAFAQEAAPAEKSFTGDPFNHPMLPFFLVMGLLFVVVILVAIVAIRMIQVIN